MRFVELQRREPGLRALVEQAQAERVLLTEDGRPVAVLIGVDGQDPEAVRLAADARVWRWLEARGRGPATICLAGAPVRTAVGPPAGLSGALTNVYTKVMSNV